MTDIVESINRYTTGNKTLSKSITNRLVRARDEVIRLRKREGACVMLAALRALDAAYADSTSCPAAGVTDATLHEVWAMARTAIAKSTEISKQL